MTSAPPESVSKWFPAILLQNFVAFPMAQEKIGESTFTLPLRLGRKESVTTAEDVKSNLDTPVALVTVIGDPIAGPDAHVSETGILCTFGEVLPLIHAGPPCYDLAAEGVGRVVIETIQLHARGLFVARLREKSVSNPSVRSLEQNDYSEFLSLAAEFLENRRDSLPLYYSEEQFAERLYPSAAMVHRKSFSATDLIEALPKYTTVGGLTDIVAQHLSASVKEKQVMLNTADALDRFKLVLATLRKQEVRS